MKSETTSADVLCPLRFTLDVIGGKWKLPILCLLMDGTPKRYGEIKRKITGITNMMLAQSLKELESYGAVHRKQYNEIPPRVEYTLAKEAEGLLEPLGLLAQWGASQMEKNTEKTRACYECQPQVAGAGEEN